MYKLFKNDINVMSVIRLTDNAYIPMDENNSDYRQYLDWVAAGNTPNPLDEESGE